MDPRIAPGLPEEVLHIVSTTDIIEKIESLILSIHGFDFKALVERTRKPNIVRARNQACYFIYLYTELSLEEIMLLFYPALKDHSSVLFAVRSIEKTLDSKKIFKNQFMIYGVDKCFDAMRGAEAMKAKHDGIWRLKSEIQ